jgi:hypothetical protein
MIRNYIYQICATAKPPLPRQRREGRGKRHRCWLFLLLSTANNSQLNRVLGGNPGPATVRQTKEQPEPSLFLRCFQLLSDEKATIAKLTLGAEKCTCG